MKRFIALGLSTLLVVPIVSSTLSWAHAEDATTTPTTTTQTEKDTTSAADKLKALAERIAKRKTDLKTRLTTAEKTRMQAKCVGAQGLIAPVKVRLGEVQTSRSAAYQNIVTKLTALSEKLKNKKIDTTALDAAITTLQAKITTFNSDLAAYQQAVDDLSAMDCKTDPDGFKASLLAARTAGQTVSQDAAAIRAYVTDTVKPLLATLRAQLEPKKAEGER